MNRCPTESGLQAAKIFSETQACQAFAPVQRFDASTHALRLHPGCVPQNSALNQVRLPRKVSKAITLWALLQAGVGGVFAHEPDEDYVFLEFHQTAIDRRFEFTSADLREKLGVDIRADGGASEERIRATAPQIEGYITNHFQIGSTTGPYATARLAQNPAL